jgi:2,3,4,5-tetrahydropyridine-2-carboxylate N-succinyltransferase
MSYAADTRASGHGIATLTVGGVTLDTWYPSPDLTALPESIPEHLQAMVGRDEVRKVERVLVSREIVLNQKPVDASDAYLRLHLLSHRKVAPHGLSLEGIFGLLSNVAWTSAGPCAVENFDAVRSALLLKYGHVTVFSVDKFPRMVDYVIPSGVRIADADRVRLGAHLASGTTVMHEGFVNFNAGTLGTSMVEGRISSGVVVGDGSDIGGGASIMGTLSGGGKEVISIGKKCLLGANSGLGISLGDNCIIESGTYVTAGAKVRLPDRSVVKAKSLSGANDITFRRNSQDGALEVVPRSGNWQGLNSILHAN